MPLSFNMKLSNPSGSFKIFVSSSNAFPTKFSCEYIFTVNHHLHYRQKFGKLSVKDSNNFRVITSTFLLLVRMI